MAYALSETSFIYPISPATSMGETMDAWASAGRLNVYGQPVRVTTMQSEGGAAGAVHGSLAAGGLSSTFTASQGLLLMVPNLYLIAGELMPTVFHVSARTVAKHALSIFNDHSDVMACRQTGFAQLCAHTVQECMDLSLVAHLSTFKTRIPFMHFFDGYRTSAQVNKINVIPYEAMQPLIPMDMLQSNLRDVGLNPVKPIIRGTGQRPRRHDNNGCTWPSSPPRTSGTLLPAPFEAARFRSIFMAFIKSSCSLRQLPPEPPSGFRPPSGLRGLSLFCPAAPSVPRGCRGRSAPIREAWREREDGSTGSHLLKTFAHTLRAGERPASDVSEARRAVRMFRAKPVVALAVESGGSAAA